MRDIRLHPIFPFMKRVVFSICLVISSLAAQAQGKELDSLKTELQKHPQEDTLRAKIIRYIFFYERAINLESAKNYAEQALHISEKINDLKGLSYSYGNLAYCYMKQGDFEKAIEYAHLMEKCSEKANFNRTKIQSLQLLGSIYFSDKNYPKSLEQYRKGEALLRKTSMKLDLAYVLNDMSTLYSHIKQYDSAESCSLESLKLLAEIGDTESMPGAYANLVDVYVSREQYDKAIEIIEKSFELLNRQKLVNSLVRATNYSNLGIIHTQTGHFKEAEAALQQAETLAKDLDKNTLLEVYGFRIQLEKARGNFKEAFRYDDLKDNLRDSLFNQERAAQIATIQTRFEVEKKEQMIQSLQQQEQIHNLKQWLLAGGLILVVATSLLIYFLQRTNHKKVEHLLSVQQDLNFKLQETDQLKSRFFANISHEFRTPLSLIITPVEDELRKNNQLAPVTKNLFSQVNRQANQLLSLVNDLLDLSKLDAKKMELRVKQGNLAHFMQLLTASFDSLAESKKISFEKRINLPEEMVWFDPEKIEKILNNLLINAFKFTPSGKSISIDVWKDSVKGSVTILVADKGIGIATEEQAHVFSSFYQVRNSADDLKGTGLGLALVKELVDLYKGSIHLQSNIGEGTTITVTLPATAEALAHAHFMEGDIKQEELSPVITITQTEQTEEETEDANERPNQPTVLVVEDHDELRNFISSIVKEKYTVIAAKNGEEGWALATEQLPDLIISDVMMPLMSGTELCEKIKTDERTSHIPVILLTAKADLESRLTGLKTGADDYLAKPFSTEELSIRSHNLLEQRRKLAEKYKQQISSPPPALFILPESPQEPSLDERFLNRARERVLANLDNSTYGVEEFATDMNLSRAQLFRKLKAIVSMSPNEFINEIRLLRAAEMIKAKTDNLSQIAYAVGFNEQSYFAKRFKKKFGVTPSVFASEHSN
jgi:pentatricopeptide repeat protein